VNKISVALCTYNGAKFLPAQLASLASQTRLPDELVITDDLSTDDTRRIIENFAAVAPFAVRFFQNEKNLGSTKNFERAISFCDGDFIFLCDQDDVWLPEKIADLSAVLESGEEIGFVFSDAELVDENLNPLKAKLWDYVFSPAERKAAQSGKWLEVLLRRNVVTGATMAFRACFRQSFTPIPTHLPMLIHDGWIALVIAAQAEARFLPKPTIKYRQHRNQQLGVVWRGDGSRGDSRYSFADDILQLEREVARLSILLDELNSRPVFAAHRDLIKIALANRKKFLEERIKHFKARCGLPKNRIKRLLPIWRELQTGRYHRFSKGFLSGAKDLLLRRLDF
jgi:glycosyltransferase involved in cell wall biosynthesis